MTIDTEFLVNCFVIAIFVMSILLTWCEIRMAIKSRSLTRVLLYAALSLALMACWLVWMDSVPQV